MSQTSKQATYLTKHLFGAGIECPQKLFYYARQYPQNQGAVPFIRHAVFNKRLLKALVRSVFPQGVFVKEDSVSAANSQTNKLLEEGNRTIFDAVFAYEKMMARLPIVQRKDNELILFHLQTKVFDSQHYSLTNQEGKIRGKWQDYLLDFAYQAYLVQQWWPDMQLRTILVLPEKQGLAKENYLPGKLWHSDDNNNTADILPANQELVAKQDVTALIDRVWHDASFADEVLPRPTFKETLYFLRDQYLGGEKSSFDIGMKCKDCEFRIDQSRINEKTKSGFDECWVAKAGLESPSEQHVFDLIGSGTKQWIAKGHYKQQQIPPHEVMSVKDITGENGRISHAMRQSLQIHKAKGNSVPGEIIRPQLIEEVNGWQYPLHFLDFEAGNYAVPIRSGRSPYDLLLFQFSCHTLYKDGSWKHHQWIDNLQSEYANYELIRQLMEVPGINAGTIIQYSNFERHALKAIRRELMHESTTITDAENLIQWIEGIIHRNDSLHHDPPYIADLSRQVKQFYYNCEMGSSLSIKDVLQSVMSYSSFLKEQYSQPYSSSNFDQFIWWQDDDTGNIRNPYSLLSEAGDWPIRRGAEAMVVFGKLISRELAPPEEQSMREALLKYCELDTLAMLMIYQHWKHQIN
ncbi:protein of unknown function(DUF2779) [Fodinibius salinus]|uniref:DUF2779 domain-containing protein n=1 Tax=Fodinibius salinus TaxID=860790 RepID=A0A5D3YM46_9BACT|nr:DUF2779 domain-containing protein [Fodinibius salinus]TYP94970.1 protein of unknown function(DUF2779) [Fodinibius salinus]